jgi:hypothetical protein
VVKDSCRLQRDVPGARVALVDLSIDRMMVSSRAALHCSGKEGLGLWARVSVAARECVRPAIQAALRLETPPCTPIPAPLTLPNLLLPSYPCTESPGAAESPTLRECIQLHPAAAAAARAAAQGEGRGGTAPAAGPVDGQVGASLSL